MSESLGFTESVMYEDSPLAEYMQSIEIDEGAISTLPEQPTKLGVGFKKWTTLKLSTRPYPSTETWDTHTSNPACIKIMDRELDGSYAHSTSLQLPYSSFKYGDSGILESSNLPLRTLSSHEYLPWVYILQALDIPGWRLDGDGGAGRLQRVHCPLHLDVKETSGRWLLPTISSVLAIGEVELVARGYRLAGHGSNALGVSSISRIEQVASVKHCLPLRMNILEALEGSFEALSIPYGNQVPWTNNTGEGPALSCEAPIAPSTAGVHLNHENRMEEEEGERESLSIRYLQGQILQLHLQRRLCLVECLQRLEELEGSPLTLYGWIRGYLYAHQIVRWLSRLSMVTECGSKAVEKGFSHRSSADREEMEGHGGDPSGFQHQWLRHIRNLERQVALVNTKLYLERSEGAHRDGDGNGGSIKEKEAHRVEWAKAALDRWISVRQALEDAKVAWTGGQLWLQHEATGGFTGADEGHLPLGLSEDADHLEESENPNGVDSSTPFDSDMTPHHWDVPGEVFEAMAEPEEFFRPASKIPREERIRLERKRRVVREQEQMERLDRDRLLLELKDVIHDRERMSDST
ncbi:hypothetical protein BJ684DRAFT_14937 [Piptocephalis cylindrospora]|uniref:Myosin-binding domain-containing protein n=1 Tax=Piptocephalis cylindrospora TaxID=1907219 RepID=A0A4P9Y8R4_9FUNG|nr:hypothetical protein BJ684DRAFT_14937 [Piptocephalis cylindrospora]|eukprot:RKP14761.1 hypothetical protein BJ684DRAFT_14937 [Piptocephalis cylindrospora]